MSQFSLFAKAVEAQFALMSKHELYVVNVDRDVVYQNYLDAFPEGTNPIFRERTEHDCSCCRQFIKNIGNVVAIINGQVVTIWDTVSNLQMDDALYPYNIVAYEMQTLVRYAKIDTIFRTVEAKFGAVLVDALAKKQAGAVDAMSAEDIAAELAKLDTPEEE